MPSENRTPIPQAGPAHRVPSDRLQADMVPAELDPDDKESQERVARFAHTFNGYARGGGPAALAPIVARIREDWEHAGTLPDDLGDLRSALFFWYRADRHGGGTGPRAADEVAWVNALLDGIRRLC